MAIFYQNIYTSFINSTQNTRLYNFRSISLVDMQDTRKKMQWRFLKVGDVIFFSSNRKNLLKLLQ